MWFSRRSPWPTDLSLDWLMALYETQNGKCAVTGVTMTFSSGGAPTNISVDRKDSTRPYDRDNVHLVCQAINYMKGNLPHEEFAWWCSQVPAPTGPVTPTTPASPTFRHSRGPLGGPHEP